jgi:hypothetical protein
MIRKTIFASVAALFLAAFGPGEWVDLPTTGDATPALNAAAAAACASSTNRTIRLPKGDFTFTTVPAVIPCALRIIGEGKGNTQLIKSYNGNGFLMWVRGTDQSGGELRDLSILTDINTSGGIAVLIQAAPDTDGTINSFNRHSFIIDNILVGRRGLSGSFDFGLYLDGAANPDGNPSSVPGIRGVFVDHSSFGGASTASVYLNKARGTDLRLECYTPIGNGFAGVALENGTDSVWLQSRNCQWTTWDGTGKGMILNGTRIGPQ